MTTRWLNFYFSFFERYSLNTFAVLSSEFSSNILSREKDDISIFIKLNAFSSLLSWNASRAYHAYPEPEQKEIGAPIFFTLERAEIRVDREKVTLAMKECWIPGAWRSRRNGFN